MEVDSSSVLVKLGKRYCQYMAGQVVKVNKFTGLNNRDAPGRIQDSEMVECQNFDLGRDGELVKRTGIKLLGTVLAGQAVTVIGYFQTSVYNQIIVRAGNNLYYTSDGTTYTLIGTYNNIEFGVQYTDKFYMVRRDDIMVQWDGAAASTIASSPTGSCCIVYKDRLYVINSFGTNPSRVYYSAIANFATAGWSGLGTFLDIQPGDGDVVVCFAILHDNFLIFKQFSTWLLYVTPDPTGWSVRNASPRIGCISKWTPREIEGFLYFVGPRGVYKTDAYSFDEMSQPVAPIFRQQVISNTLLNQTVAAWWEDKYIVILQTFPTAPTWGSWANRTWDSLAGQGWDSSNASYTWLVYHLRPGNWTHWLPASGALISAFNFAEVQGPSGIKGLYIGSRALDGKLFRYGDAVYTDGTNSTFDCIVESKDFDFDTPEYAKRGFWTQLERQGAGTVDVYNIADGNTQVAKTLTFINNRQALKAPGPGYFRVWRVKSISTHDGPVTLYGFTVCVAERKSTLALS